MSYQLKNLINGSQEAFLPKLHDHIVDIIATKYAAAYNMNISCSLDIVTVSAQRIYAMQGSITTERSMPCEGQLHERHQNHVLGGTTMFEKAARQHIRFSSPIGNLTVEDLWDLPLTGKNPNQANLDDIAKELYAAIKEGDTVSFVNKPAKADDELRLKFDIVKHIIDIRLAERDAEATQQANRMKKQQILRLIADKENDALASQSLEELRKMAESL